MVFILGNNFSEYTLVKKALESFYGIGPNVSTRIMARHHIFPRARLRDIPNKQALDLTAELSKMTIENDLRRKLVENITRLRDMKSYRGMRHAFGLPVRGQRTRNQISSAIKLNRIERRG